MKKSLLLGFGNATVNVLPLFNSLSNAIVPCDNFTACFTIDNPKPVPPVARECDLSTR